MFDRILIAFGVLAVVTLTLWAIRQWLEHRNATIEARLRGEIESGDVGVPVSPRIVYFTTQTCMVCRGQQEPAIDSLSDHVSDLVVEQYDAIECGQLAEEYGVLSVPTIAVYDRTGHLVTINRGFTSAAILYAQINGKELQFPEGTATIAEPVESSAP